MKPYIFDVSENDALPLEYKLNKRNALRNANLSDFVNNTAFMSFISPEKSSFKEKVFDIFGGKVCVLDENVSDH